MRTKYVSNCYKVDWKEISELIALYQAQIGKSPNYLIMNDDTIKSIKGNLNITLKPNPNGCETIYGIDIATCNRLKFGEVEVV